MEKTDTLIKAIIVITSIFTLVAIFVTGYVIYFNKRKSTLIQEKDVLQAEYKKQLQQSQIEVQEQTLQNIGKELHDNIGQLLSTARMLLGLCERSMERPPDTLLTANATLAQAISELRSFSRSLDKEWLERFNLVQNLNVEVTRINSGNEIKAQFIYDHEPELSADEQIILFRIAQEAIQNSIKHADTPTLLVDLKRNDAEYRLSIVDEGSGLTPTFKDGMGVMNMKHRTALLGGSISWNANPDKGTIVTISLPLKNKSL